MWKQQEATNLLKRLIIILILAAQLLDTTQALSDKRLCADENCKEIISLGIGKINYRAGAEGMVSFKINSPIRIKSKSAGSDLSLWGIEVNGREGYAPKDFIRETKVKISEKNLKFIVDVIPPNSVPILSTSEKPVTQENTVETTTTKPLEAVPLDSTEQPVINNNLNENLTTETPAAATPVLSSEVVDGTPIPIFNNDSDGIVETVNEPVKPLTRYEDEELVEDDYDDEEDDEIGDYDEDEEELEMLLKKVKKPLTKEEEKSAENIDLKVEQEKQNIKEEKEEEDPAKQEEKVNQQEVFEKLEDNNKLKLEENLEQAPESKKLETSKDSGENAIDSSKTNDQNKEEDQTGNVQTPQLLNLNLTENEVDNKQELEIPLHSSNENVDKITENLEKLEENQENLVKQDENKVESSENVKEEPKLETQTTPLPLDDSQENVLNNEENKLDVNNNPTTIDNTNLSVEDKTDNLIETNDNTKENSNTNDNHHNEHEHAKELSTEDVAPTETQSNEDHQNKHEDLINQQEQQQYQEISSTESNNYQQQEQQTETYYNTNPTEALLSDKQTATIDNTNSLPYQQQEQQQHSHTTENLEQQQDNVLSNTQNEENLNIQTSTESQQYYDETTQPEQVQSSEVHEQENINPTIYPPYNEVPQSTPSPYSAYDYNYQQQQQQPSTEIPPNDYYAQQYGAEVTTESSHTHYHSHSHYHEAETTTVGYNNVPTEAPVTTPKPIEYKEEQPKALPSSTPSSATEENKENKGLFATIMGTVNNVLSINKKHKHQEFEEDNELDRILFSQNGNGHKMEAMKQDNNLQYCKKLGPNGDCPESEHEHDHDHHNHHHNHPHTHHEHHESSDNTLFGSDLTLDSFFKALASKILELSELLAFLVISAAASLFFIFGYYCFCNSSREGALLSKLNQLESSLLATHKENSILKHNLMSTRQKLASIEDNSFGSNDMVVSLKKELEEELMEKARLQEQITVLQKELENAADAGIELNKIVAELLSNQTGDESIISSVEELQKQLNEQQNTILEINASLAEKSRENSELQLLIAEQNARYESQLANLQRDNDELEHEKGTLLTKLEEMKNDFDKDITAALEGKNFEIKRLQNEIVDLSNKVENEHTKWQTSVAKIEALEECLKNVRKDPNVNITEVIDVANVKAQLIETQKKYTSIKERLEIELDQRKLSENQVQILSAEVEKLKQDFNQSEKDKLEAQTRLEVLSNYFKDKENQLQKELSLKEAMWLKQQGETTTTVDRVTAMQEEIQSLKSQNDALRAEIEAQVAAHKAQTGTLENRAHETWLAARQSDRRYEEARAEATALRRKLTALAGGNVNEVNKTSAGPAGLGEELPQAPSPIHMEPPGSPLLGRMPPPPFLPPPFMGPPPPFMGMPPPPPFVPPGEMRPAPLGRIMSPPPQRSGRFSPQHLDYEDYLDYEGNNTWHRHTYSPPRTYRSLSPTDSRYNYGTERDLISTYDTETDFSPPPSPRESRRRVINSSERIDNNKSPYGSSKKFGNKGLLSSGSEKSYTSPSHRDNKTKKGNSSSGGGGGKNLV